MVNNWIERFQFLRPVGRCLLCDTGLEADTGICTGCDRRLPRVRNPCIQCGEPLPAATDASRCGRCLVHRPAFDLCVAPLVYDAEARSLHQQFKFHHNLAAGKALANLLARHLKNSLDVPPGLLLPVPLHASRMRQRGYDQALEIAKIVSKETGVPVASRHLQRLHNTPPQSGLKRQQRMANLKDAFTLGNPLEARRVALVDDIMTTGSTFEAASRVLKSAGAEHVQVWAVSRTPSR